MIDAIAWKIQTGSQRVHLPEKYGNWRGVYNRLQMWSAEATWERVFTPLVAQADAERDLNWSSRLTPRLCGPTSTQPETAKKGGPADEPDDHGIGRSRGGLTRRIHLAADGNCRPLAFHLTAGQAGDAPAFADVMACLRVPRRRGRSRDRPDVVLAHKAYSSRAIREHLSRHGIRAVIPVRLHQR